MRLLLLFPLLALSALAQQTPAAPGPSHSAPGFSISNMDRTANPCADFYQYACGTWMADNPIPADQSVWGMSSQLLDHNREILRAILDKASVDDPKRSAVEQKIGDFYASCTDEATIDKLGIQPLAPELERIDAIRSKDQIVDELVRLHLLGVGVLFRFSSSPDAKHSTQVIADADQGGLGLPDRDYYLKTDAKSVKLREQYVAHVQKMLELSGESSAEAASGAQAVLHIETELAKGSLSRVARRDPLQTYHKMSVKELSALSPGIDWPKYFSGLGTPAFTDLNVGVPDFFKDLNTVLKDTSLADLKVYLRWHLLHAEAPLMAKPFLDENFSFYRPRSHWRYPIGASLEALRGSHR